MYIFTTLELPNKFIAYYIAFHVPSKLLSLPGYSFLTFLQWYNTYAPVCMQKMYVKLYLITLASTTKADFNEGRHSLNTT